MKRLKQINQAALDKYGDSGTVIQSTQRKAFREGAEWADKNPNYEYYQEYILKKLEKMERFAEVLSHIAKTDSCCPQMGGPDKRFLTDWRNETKRLAQQALENE